MLLCGLLVVAIAAGRWGAGRRAGGDDRAVVLLVAGVATPFAAAGKAEALTLRVAAVLAAGAGRGAGERQASVYRLHGGVVPELPGEREAGAEARATCRPELQQGNVVLMRADWTQYDPAITTALTAVGRSGVPTYVIYPGKPEAAPDVLPELLTKDVVLNSN